MAQIKSEWTGWKLHAYRGNIFGIRGGISKDILVIVGGGKKIERE